MAEESKPKAKNVKRRSTDQRGSRPGQATTPQPGGRGAIGQKPYVATDRDREYVRKHCFYLGNAVTAERLGISKDTLERHFRPEIDESADELRLAAGMSAVKRALEGDGPMLRFVLQTRFGDMWSRKHSLAHTGPGGGPIRTVDLSGVLKGKTEEQLADLEQLLDHLIAQADPDGSSVADLGEAAGDGGAAAP